MGKKRILLFVLICMQVVLLCACFGQRELVNMERTSVDGKSAIVWEDRTYVIFCVVSKSSRGKQIGYVDGDKDDRISEYRGYAPEEWLVSWLPSDGGAMLLKEINVTEIPEGLIDEYS